MNDCKLGKAMAPDTKVERRPKDASNHSATRHSAQVHSRASLAYARSIPRNRSSARHDLPVPPRLGCWQSDRLSKSQVKDMRAAAEFAYRIGHPLNLCIDINWTRAWVGDDPDGRILSRLMELSRKWLKPRYCRAFALIAVRENPNGCPNTHILMHCPPSVLSQFKEQVRNVLNEACHDLNDHAVVFRSVGRGNPTLQAAMGKLAYMCKGMDPDEAKEFGIRCAPQGWVYGKRASISQDIHRAARQRHAEAEGSVTYDESKLQVHETDLSWLGVMSLNSLKLSRSCQSEDASKDLAPQACFTVHGRIGCEHKYQQTAARVAPVLGGGSSMPRNLQTRIKEHIRS